MFKKISIDQISLDLTQKCYYIDYVEYVEPSSKFLISRGFSLSIDFFISLNVEKLERADKLDMIIESGSKKNIKQLKEFYTERHKFYLFGQNVVNEFLSEFGLVKLDKLDKLRTIGATLIFNGKNTYKAEILGFYINK